jgi:hypothetical protein
MHAGKLHTPFFWCPSQALPQVMHELMLELQVVKTLDHPSICGFVGASARFPRSNQAHRDWSIGLIFEL